MGRKRTVGHRDLPANLYPNRGGWKYVHPVTKKPHYWSVPKQSAIDTAKKLNAILLTRTDLVAKVLGDGQTVKDAIKVFRTDDVPHRKWAEKTADEAEIKLRKIERDIGSRELSSYSIRDAAQYLKDVTDSSRARQQYRNLLIWVWACAIEEGWCDTNVFSQTRRPKSNRQRQRLTIEAFSKIKGNAEPWLQRAMDLALATLLRRADICTLKFTDIRDGVIYVQPQKTEDSTGVRLAIKMDDELVTLIGACRDNVASPYVIHRLPERLKPMHQRASNRAHHTQVLPEQLTRAFDEAREASKLFEDHDNPPTFHEIRSLGGEIKKAKGWTLQQVQALMGHSSEEMTKHYSAGHEKPWTEIQL